MTNDDLNSFNSGSMNNSIPSHLKHYITSSKEIFNLAIIDIFVLQRMALINTPLVRYQLMMETRRYIPEVSNARFYRILEKLHKYKLVDEIENKTEYNNSEQLQYVINNTGLMYLESSRELTNQFGFNIAKYFEHFIPQMISMISGQGNLLLIDPGEIMEIALLEPAFTSKMNIFIVADDRTFNYQHKVFDQLQQVNFIENKLETENEAFNSIVVFYPTLFHSDAIVSEIYRVLKPDGSLLLVDSQEVENKHFLFDILYQAYAPELFKVKKPYHDFQTKIHVSNFSSISNESFNGLIVEKYKKYCNIG